MLSSSPLGALLRGPVLKRAQQGLYAGKTIQFGNKISESEHKTRRTWKPNVHARTLYSALLDKYFRIKVTAAALRTIDKKGGLDPYLLTTKDEKIDSELGLKLKGKMLKALQIKKQTMTQSQSAMSN